MARRPSLAAAALAALPPALPAGAQRQVFSSRAVALDTSASTRGPRRPALIAAGDALLDGLKPGDRGDS